MMTMRCFFALVAELDLELHKMDLKTTFLHGDLNEEIYMHQPEGFVEKGKEALLCQLLKSLYGMKQSPHAWYHKFHQFILSQEYKHSELNHCLYTKQAKDGNWLKRHRSAKFIWLSQIEYIDKVLQHFNMDRGKALSVPLPSYVKISKQDFTESEEQKVEMEKIPYASTVGSLMYATIATRRDIAFAVGVVSRYMSNPGKKHWEIVKGILRYLKATKNMCICYGSQEQSLVGYIDLDYAGDLDNRRSTLGYVFRMAVGAVSWRSRLQISITQSTTTEVEYDAVSEACKEEI
ncbi:hypothetical protein L7F22_005149 [Adiantum nelumboides]|nr:hypothetical protein [Adiantum nelumboides]